MSPQGFIIHNMATVITPEQHLNVEGPTIFQRAISAPVARMKSYFASLLTENTFVGWLKALTRLIRDIVWTPFTMPVALMSMTIDYVTGSHSKWHLPIKVVLSVGVLVPTLAYSAVFAAIVTIARKTWDWTFGRFFKEGEQDVGNGPRVPRRGTTPGRDRSRSQSRSRGFLQTMGIRFGGASARPIDTPGSGPSTNA